MRSRPSIAGRAFAGRTSSRSIKPGSEVESSMNRIVRTLAIGMVAVAVTRPSTAQIDRFDRSSAQPLTLDEAINYALKNNRDVSGSALSVASANEAVENARVKRLPSLEVSSMAGQAITEVGVDFPAGAFGTFPGLGPIPSVDTRVTSPRRPVMQVQASLMQPISQLHRINLNIKATSAGRNMEQEQRRATMQAVAANVRKAYYALLQIDAGLRAADAVLASTRALDGVVTERVAQRVSLKGDGLQSQLRVAEASQERLKLQNRRDESGEQFTHARGPRAGSGSRRLGGRSRGGNRTGDRSSSRCSRGSIEGRTRRARAARRRSGPGARRQRRDGVSVVLQFGPAAEERRLGRGAGEVGAVGLGSPSARGESEGP